MRHDRFGVPHVTEKELCKLLYKDPSLDFDQILVDDPEQYNRSIKVTYSSLSSLKKYVQLDINVDEYDTQCQQRWLMPDDYVNMDIAKWVLDQCQTQSELQRVGQELLLFHEKNLFPLLRYLKYLIDTLEKNQIVWGVGRGSSVASYVLYLIGVHKINSLYYDLPIEEFLKD